jgi:hypothetical protein
MQRVAALVAAALVAVTCGSSGLFRQYEYEEDIHLSLDGTATVYVNGSMAAFDVLRGAPFASDGSARLDRRRIQEFFSTPVTRFQRATMSRRGGRRFVHVRIDVQDIRRLSEAAPFAWSMYQFYREGDLYVFKQVLGGDPMMKVEDVGDESWTGREWVAFRVHVPSKITYHNTLPENLKRGNILVWEQTLEERRRGTPLVLDARMQTQSILYRTIFLFGAMLAVVGLMFGLLIWWILRQKRTI